MSLSNADLNDGSFEPTIVSGLGYTGNRAQLMSVPPFAATFACTCSNTMFTLMFIHLKNSVIVLVYPIGPLPVSWIHLDILYPFATDWSDHVLRYVKSTLSPRTGRVP